MRWGEVKRRGKGRRNEDKKQSPGSLSLPLSLSPLTLSGGGTTTTLQTNKNVNLPRKSGEKWRWAVIVFDCLLPTTLLQVRYEMETAQNSANFVWRKKEIPKQKQAKEEKEGDRRHTRTRTRVSGGGGDTKIDSLGNGEQWRVYSLPVCVQLTLDWQKQLRLSLSWSVAGRFDKRGHLQEKVGVYVKKRLTLPAAAGQHSPLLLFTGHIRRWASSVRR